MEPTLKELLAKYSGKVKLAYRDFPIREIHAHAELAAEASRCAAEQGKFWEYHDSLFSSQEELDREDLLRKADAATADRHRLTDCLNQGKYIQQVDHDVQDGIRAGVSSTPTFFVNGILLTGAMPPNVFEEIIETELRREIAP